MRVAFFHQSADLYGSDRVLFDLVTSLSKYGVEPIVLLPGVGLLSHALERENIPVRFVPVFKVSRTTLGPKGLLRLARQVPGALSAIDAVLADHAIDLVHSNTLAVFAGAFWAHRHHIPHIWHVHEIVRQPWIARKLLPLRVRYLSGIAVCNSRASRDWLVSEQPTLARRSSTIWNGVNLQQKLDSDRLSDVSAAIRVQGYRVVIGLVGRINQWKGHLLLIEAAEILAARGIDDFSIAFVGSPVMGHEHLRDALMVRIARSGIARRIVLLDFQEDIWPVWKTIDICCVPSTRPEPFGLVAIEAMSMGKPVVAANHGGLPEIVDNGQTGILFEPNNAPALADALSRLITDHVLRVEMGKAAKQIVSLNFSAEAMVTSFLNLYQTVLTNK
jgi:glycosyltransferase involved in cell wall biosynthesis